MTDFKNTDPAAFPRRSPLYRTLANLGARFVEVGDTCVAAGIGADPNAKTEAVQNLAICDLSTLPRTGFKGKDAAEWLRNQGLRVEEENNRAYRQESGSLAVRLGRGDILVLGALSAEDSLCARLEATWSIDRAGECYPVPRRSGTFWFLVTGKRAPEMFAKVCSIDFRPRTFSENAVAQTTVARSDAIVVRTGPASKPVFQILGDSASALYLWECLLDAMSEFDGTPVGLAAIHDALGIRSAIAASIRH